MKGFWLAGLLALSLGLSATPGEAQVRLDGETAERANERQETVAEATNRISGLLGETLGAPGISVANSPNSLAVAITAKSEDIAMARRELSEISQSLSALPPLGRNGGPDILRGIDAGTLKVAELAGRADAVLEAMQRIPAAVATADQARFDAAYRGMVSGMVVLHEVQAAMLRRETLHQEDGDPQKAQFLAMACLSDGQAGLQAGMSGLVASEVATGKLTEAGACMREQLVRGRSDLEAVKTANPMRVQLYPLDVALFDRIEQAADWLDEVSAALARNENSGVIAGTFNPRFAQITVGIQELTDRQRRIIADQ